MLNKEGTEDNKVEKITGIEVEIAPAVSSQKP
jgi:hypothetical protein